MKQGNKRIKLAMVAVLAIVGIIFGTSRQSVQAEGYAAPPQQVTFGESYSDSIGMSSTKRYDFDLKKAGTVKIIGNMDQLNMANGANYYKNDARIYIYDESGKELYEEYVGGNTGSQYFEITANLDKGNYYFTIGDSFWGINYTLKPTYKEFPTASIKQLSNQKGKKLKVKWSKKVTVSGYQIQIATNSKFTKGKKTYTINMPTTTSQTITKLKKAKKYYVRVRTYTITLDGTKAYSKWSGVKNKKITK